MNKAPIKDSIHSSRGVLTLSGLDNGVQSTISGILESLLALGACKLALTALLLPEPNERIDKGRPIFNWSGLAPGLGIKRSAVLASRL